MISIFSLSINIVTTLATFPSVPWMAFENYSEELTAWAPTTTDHTYNIAGYGSRDFDNSDTCWNFSGPGLTDPGSLPIPWINIFSTVHDHVWRDTISNPSPYPVVWIAQNITGSGSSAWVGTSSGNHYKRGASKDLWNVVQEPD